MISASPKCTDAIKLAKSSRWDELRSLVESNPATAQQVDSYGMLPIHWVCTEPHSTSETVLMALLKAYPQGSKHTNTAGMVPLQIAIKAQANIEWLQALLASNPHAVLKKVTTGENGVQLARKCQLELRCVRLLEEMYRHVCEVEGIQSLSLEDRPKLAGTASFIAGKDAKSKVIRIGSVQDLRSAQDPKILFASSFGSSVERSMCRIEGAEKFGMTHSSVGSDKASADRHATSLSSDMQGNQPVGSRIARTIVSLPPRWTNAASCHICSYKFGTFKKRHHCRNCGHAICSEHSAREKMRLPHYGLHDRHRVCILCYEVLLHAVSSSTQRRRTRLVSAGSVAGVMGIPPRQSDEAARDSNQYQQQLRLERHVSAPVVSNENQSHSDHESIHRQVQDLQKQVTKLMEEKKLAESQLRVQAELLLEAERHTNSSCGSSNDIKRSSGASIGHQILHKIHSGNALHSNVKPSSGSTLVGTGSSGFDSVLTVTSEPSSSPRRGPSDVEDQERDKLHNEQVARSVQESNCSLDKSEDGTLMDDDDDDDSVLPEVEVLVNLGLSLLDKGSANAAVQAFSRALELCPNDPTLLSYLGKAQYADNELDNAAQSIVKSIAIEVSAANLTLLGKIYFEKGDHEKAIDAYQKSLAIQEPSK